MDEATYEDGDLANLKARSFAPGQGFFDDLDDDEDDGNWVDDDDVPEPECRQQ